MKRFLFAMYVTVFPVIFLSSANSVTGATFNVADVVDLQNALTAAESNSQNDTINIAAGTYNLLSTLTYNSSENYSLTVSGAGKSATFLDGGNTLRIFTATTIESSAHIVIQNMVFRNGRTAQNGGALSVSAGGSANITIDNCVFSDNAATAQDSVGGGVNITTESGTANIISSEFFRNTSSANVGGLFSGTNSGTTYLTNCTFEDNSVTNSEGSGSGYFGDGGGAMLYSDGTSQVIITGNTFANNSASGGNNPDGGGLMTYQLGANSSVILRSNTFNGNTAGGGGGCIVRLNAGGNAEIENNVFSGNRSLIGTGGGASVHIDGGSLSYTGNTHTNNRSADDGGGAVINFTTDTATISNNIFSSNEAAVNGGGLVVATDSATINISRNIFSSNTSGNSGGGLSYATGTGNLSAFNNTFYGNSAADGGGMYLYFDQVTASSALRNNILWHDTSNELNYSFGSGSGTFVVTYSDVENGSGELWFGTGCISTDPLFANAAGGDFNLTWTGYPIINVTRSPCIDRGDPSSPHDPDNTRADMGALAYTQTGKSRSAASGAINLLLLSE